MKTNSEKALLNKTVLLENFERKRVVKIRKVDIKPVEDDDDGLTIPDYRKTLAKI